MPADVTMVSRQPLRTPPATKATAARSGPWASTAEILVVGACVCACWACNGNAMHMTWGERRWKKGARPTGTEIKEEVRDPPAPCPGPHVSAHMFVL